jgi:hypothetical protein
MLMLTDRWSIRIGVDNFTLALLESLVISLITTILSRGFKSKKPLQYKLRVIPRY